MVRYRMGQYGKGKGESMMVNSDTEKDQDGDDTRSRMDRKEALHRMRNRKQKDDEKEWK